MLICRVNFRLCKVKIVCAPLYLSLQRLLAVVPRDYTGSSGLWEAFWLIQDTSLNTSQNPDFYTRCLRVRSAVLRCCSLGVNSSSVTELKGVVSKVIASGAEASERHCQSDTEARLIWLRQRQLPAFLLSICKLLTVAKPLLSSSQELCSRWCSCWQSYL